MECTPCLVFGVYRVAEAEVESLFAVCQVLTGDSLCVAKRICADMGIENTHCATGGPPELAHNSDYVRGLGLPHFIASCSV